MITSVRLQNWTSFGPEQTAELSPITVLVGANNSGKSNFLRTLQHIDDWSLGTPHRPGESPMTATRAISLNHRGVPTSWNLYGSFEAQGMMDATETVVVSGSTAIDYSWHPGKGGTAQVGSEARSMNARVATPQLANDRALSPLQRDAIAAVLTTTRGARLVHLNANASRLENQLASGVTVSADGGLLAAVIARWTLELPERRDEFNAILCRCIPEMKRVHAPPSSVGNVRLQFEQQDGERFDANEVSDGVILFSALIAHALEAPEDGLVLIEEPERGLHPRRLVELLDVLRTLVEKRKTQFVLATHSPALLALFRDEPEAILLFRRTDTGTQVRRLSDVPELVETLERADPGELLASGAFNEDYALAGPPKAAE